jgi:hypothetical protein
MGTLLLGSEMIPEQEGLSDVVHCSGLHRQLNGYNLGPLETSSEVEADLAAIGS